MNQCKLCRSYAINVGRFGRDESDPDLCDVCYWKSRAERLQGIVDRLPDLVGIVASDCGATNDDRPSLYKRGNLWRYHVMRAGNQWADDADPIKAAEKAGKA